MPCHDGGVPYPPSEEEVLDRKAPAMLCAILRTIPNALLMEFLKEVDWSRAGVSAGEFAKWWKLHQQLDALREANEARQRDQKATRKKALAKLTPEERAALGVNE